jgi:hypothetical protein
MTNKIDDGNEMKRLQRVGSAYSYDDVGALANRFGTVLEEAAPDPGLALSALMCVAASVIHRMEKYGEHTDPDMVWSPPSASWPSSSKASGGGKGTD